MQFPSSLPSTSLRSSSGMLHWPILNYRHPGQPSLRHHCSTSNLSRQCFSGRLVVAPERDSVVPEFVPFLGTSIAHVILCLRSRMTSTRVTRSSDSFSPRNHSPLTHAALPPSRLEHRISCAARSHRAPSYRILGGWLSWVTDVSYLCAPVIESHSHGSSQSTHCHILVVFRSAHPVAVKKSFSSLGHVFLAHFSCRQKVGLLQWNVTRLLGSLPSAN